MILRRIVPFAFLLMVLPVCVSQNGRLTVRHGTVIVIFFSEDRVVLAADSRRTFFGGRQGYEDTQCKVSDLGQETIFAGSGVSGFNFGPEQLTAAFDTYKTALRTAHSLENGTTDRAQATADGWSRLVKTALDEQLARHPEEIMSSLHGSSNLLAGGVFAGKTSEGLSVYFAAVNCECSGRRKYSSIHITRLQPTRDGLPAATIGTAEAQNLFSELVESNSERARIERTTWPGNSHDADGNVDVTIRTAEFILHNSRDHTIGGPINAIELDHDGKIRWIKREKFCK